MEYPRQRNEVQCHIGHDDRHNQVPASGVSQDSSYNANRRQLTQLTIRFTLAIQRKAKFGD